MISPIHLPVVRNDDHGQGHFGAYRGYKLHRGVDLVAPPGEVVHSPCVMKIVRLGWPYENESKKHLQLIVANCTFGYMKFMYVSPHVEEGMVMSEGQPIGVAQDVTETYVDEGMALSHIHWECWMDFSKAINARENRFVPSIVVDPMSLLGL